MKNVKVILISVVLCAAVFANSRTAALGGAEFWAGDRANIAIFPATINDHDFVEMDGVGGADANATILWGDATTWGFGFDGTDDDTWMNIYWGNGDVGLNVAYISADATPTVVDSENSGFAVSYGQNFDWGELGCGFKSGYEIDGEHENDASEYWAKWRDDMNAWVFDSATASLSSTDDGQTNGRTTMDLGFAMFTHLDAGGADVLFGLGVDYHSEETNNLGVTSMTLPSATLAVEADLTDWATLRAWASHEYGFSCTNDDAAGTDPCTDDATGVSGTDYGFGLGFNWGAAQLDMQVGTQLFTNPVATMTGFKDLDTEGTVTLSYSF